VADGGGQPRTAATSAGGQWRRKAADRGTLIENSGSHCWIVKKKKREGVALDSDELSWTAAGRWPEAEGSSKRWTTMKMQWTELRLGEQDAHWDTSDMSLWKTWLRQPPPATGRRRTTQTRPRETKPPALIPYENKRIIHNWRVLIDPSHNLLFIMIKTDTMEDERSKDCLKYLGTTHRVH